MAKATWKGKVIAESDKSEVVEGNQYFPPESVKREHLQPSETTSVCPWKGTASYYHVVVDGETNKDAAWYYPDPKDAAKRHKDHLAFWRGGNVETKAVRSTARSLLGRSLAALLARPPRPIRAVLAPLAQGADVFFSTLLALAHEGDEANGD